MNRHGTSYQSSGEHSKRVTAKYYQDGASVTLPMPNGRHINRFLKRRCSLDLLNPELNLNWDAKEISESEAIAYAIQKKLEIHPSRPDVLVFCVGDGFRPRTGALLAFSTKWTMVSIDPGLFEEWLTPKVSFNVDRLHTIKKKVEHVEIEEIEEIINYNNFREVVIACPHSHARLKDCKHLLNYGYGHVVTMPCCVPQELPERVFCDYYDWSCLSGERRILIWRNVVHV